MNKIEHLTFLHAIACEDNPASEEVAEIEREIISEVRKQSLAYEEISS